MKRRMLNMNLFSGLSSFLFAFVVVLGCNTHNGTVDPPLPAPPEQKQTSTPEKALPDLRITEIQVKPKLTAGFEHPVIMRGTNYSFRVRVKNEGQGQVSGGIAVSVKYGCEGIGVGHSGTYTVDKSGLSSPLIVEIPPSKSPGTCRFTFVVDPDNITEEEDEKNNVRKTTYQVV